MRRLISLAGIFLVWFACLPHLSSQDINDPDPKKRKEAAKDLADVGVPALEKLRQLLKDPDVEVRREAVKSIVKIDTQYSLDPLIEATRDNDEEVQLWAIDGLVNFYVPGYVEHGIAARLRRFGRAVVARFSDEPEDISLAVDPYIKVRPDVIQALGQLARSGVSMQVRASAARAIGVLRGKEAIPDLLEAIRTKNSRVMYEVLIALQKIRDPSVAPRIRFLIRDLEEKIQITAIETVGLFRDKEAVPELRDVLVRTRDKDVRRKALEALTMIADPSTRELFRAYINDDDEHLRAAAAEGLGRIGNPEDRPLLEQLYRTERERRVRLSLAFALVKMGHYEYSEFSPLKYLVDNLNSSAWNGVARPFLVELARQAEVRKVLNKIITGGTKDEKIHLARVLAESGDRDSIQPLEILTRDPDDTVAREAIRALQTLRARLG